MNRRSIGFRLTLWYAAVLTAGLGLFGALVWFSLRHELLADVDRELAGGATRFENYFRAESKEPGIQLEDELTEFCQALPPGSFISLRGTNGFTFHYPPADSANGPAVRILRKQFHVDGQRFDLEVRASTGAVLHTLELLRLLLLGLVPVVIVIACLGGAWLSRRALRPVHDIAAAALTISIENLSGRLPVPATGDELAYLTRVLNTMLERLESAVQTLSQFVADASHELRTPLAVILTGAELALRRMREPESYRSSLAQIAQEARRMTQLVEDLLLLARGGANIVETPLEPVDLRGIAGAVCAEARTLAAARRIRVTLSAPERAAVVVANPGALHRLLLALLDNAVKYSRDGGDVNVAVTRDDSRACVTVQDFGTGIAERDLPHIFERFYRADRARGGGGHGLGLALAQTIAKAHGAAIEVSSVEGSGSVFRVAFSCGPPEREAPGPADAMAAVDAQIPS